MASVGTDKRLNYYRQAPDEVVAALGSHAHGLTNAEADELVGTIRALRRRGVSIVWIEHIVQVLVQVTERLICMDAGKIIADGTPQAVLADRNVVEAYLGGAPA